MNFIREYFYRLLDKHLASKNIFKIEFDITIISWVALALTMLALLSLGIVSDHTDKGNLWAYLTLLITLPGSIYIISKSKDGKFTFDFESLRVKSTPLSNNSEVTPSGSVVNKNTAIHDIFKKGTNALINGARRKKKSTDTGLSIFLLILIGLIIIPSGIPIFVYLLNSSVGEFWAIFLGVGYVVVVPILLKIIADALSRRNYNKDLRIIRASFRKIDELYKVISIEENRDSNIEEILTSITTIYGLIEDIQAVKTASNWDYKSRTEFDNSIKEVLTHIIPTITDIRTDLSMRVKAEIVKIDTAQREISRNKFDDNRAYIELIQIQQTRLNRQIEQFEELQKILV